MDGEANLPVPPRNLPRSALDADTTPSSSSSSPHFLRNIQAAVKRHRSIGTMQTNSLRPRRMLVPQRQTPRNAAPTIDPTVGTEKFRDVVPLSQGRTQKESIGVVKNSIVAIREAQEDASITPSFSGTITKTFDETSNPFDVQLGLTKCGFGCNENNAMPLSHVESQHVDGKRKVQVLTANSASFQEMEWNTSNQVGAPNIIDAELKNHNLQNNETEISVRSDGAVSLLAKRTAVVQDQLHHFLSQPATQSSVVGSSCPTTISVHSSSAPMMTYCYRSHPESSSLVATEQLEDFNVNPQHLNQTNNEQMPHPSIKVTSGRLIDHSAIAVQASNSANDAKIKEHHLQRELGSVSKEFDYPKDASLVADKPSKDGGSAYGVIAVQSEASLSTNPSKDAKLEPSKPEKQEKLASGKGVSAPRKRSYDPDLFFKVNGKLYQRLGKIGSGGSSEVHKVISSDCTIYALKKIKLKGRDYATAYGFCQEIEYLNRLKGKNNIIQLTDYEVTDKTMLREVLNGSMNNKDGRVKDDAYIYMVLEYGEIDLAHMLSQKWKEMDGSCLTIDENWLRFYWQQILQAVNTIHEERIVHSDLKPANFLLVKGFLKLIDFGIAKAIMSDTTNIQRDSQVGTLSYMSPEAFMCNESDANGNTIKCGRPSDIWSLGCILYQMVYGRTPFSEYKTFWAKFKVITDPNHVITYEPVSNPWLLDLMKKCLAWDRNERWRIPELLKHPFLVPPPPSHSSLSQEQQGSKLLQLVAEACAGDQRGSMLCSELQKLLENPLTPLQSQSLTSRDQLCQLLSHVSRLCDQLQEHLAKS